MTRELPIFPLPIVLFPGSSQPLHIFEPRYRQLLADCLGGDRRFGIAYVAADPAAPDRDPVPEPGDIGCVAVIGATHALPDGRSNILTEGERRFVLLEWVPQDVPYRVARVEEFDDEPFDPVEITTLAGDVREHFQRLINAIGARAGGMGETERGGDPPQDPARLSFHVAAALDLDPEVKCALLALRSTSHRLRQLAAVLRTAARDAESHAVVARRARGNGRARA